MIWLLSIRTCTIGAVAVTDTDDGVRTRGSCSHGRVIKHYISVAAWFGGGVLVSS